jgi:uncharacterized protein YabE (DUF348 family)
VTVGPVTLSLPVALSDETPRGTLNVVFSLIDENGEDTSRSLVDPSSAITQVRLKTK